jgi:hypothetical protein
MKGIRFLIFLIGYISLLTGIIQAQFQPQDFPLDIRKAYEKGTRSMDGKPGKNYWLNHSEYDIKVTLVPSKLLLKGKAQIIYANNSPDTLNTIVMRLYPDLYKKGAARDFALDPADINDGVIISYLSIDDREVDIDLNESAIKRSGTNMTINLDSPLNPGHTIDLAIDWRYQLPLKRPVRTGAYSDSAFFIAYWYPQIAVYDDIDGWDMINYDGMVEYYNDFSDFEVEITAPDDYLVWATGELQNADDILSEDTFKQLEKARISDEVIHVVDRENLATMTHFEDGNPHKWEYTANYIPDFAFAASNYFLWDATSARVDENEDRRVLVNVAYPPESPDFHEVAQISKKILEYMSIKFPGVPYPYPVMTAFNRPGSARGGGMEFPMMINDGSHSTRAKTVGLTIHEIAHTYFPFYTGTNERKYSFMDEGWAHMFPFIIQPVLEPASDPICSSVKAYTARAGQESELPMMIPSNSLGRISYRIAAYNRPGIAYHILREMLGPETFDKALREFIDRWHGKHPIPYDFFFTFNQVAGEDLAWFWKPWFFEHGYPDVAISSVEVTDQLIMVKVSKKGNIPVPVKLTAYFADSTKEVISHTAAVWRNGNSEITIKIPGNSDLLKLELGNGHIPDVNRDNDVFIP